MDKHACRFLFNRWKRSRHNRITFILLNWEKLPIPTDSGQGPICPEEASDFELWLLDAKEYLQQMLNSAQMRADKAFDSPQDFMDWLTMGMTEGLRSRYEKLVGDPNVENFFNWLSLGFVDTVKGAVNPEKPLSLEHWLDSLGVVTTVAGGYKLTKEAINLRKPTTGKPTKTNQTSTVNLRKKHTDALQNGDARTIHGMTRNQLRSDLPEGWTYHEHNGRIHVKDELGNYRVRVDPPDRTTQYQHIHIFDADRNSLDIDGNIVGPKDPAGHIPWED